MSVQVTLASVGYHLAQGQDAEAGWGGGEVATTRLPMILQEGFASLFGFGLVWSGPYSFSCKLSILG